MIDEPTRAELAHTDYAMDSLHPCAKLTYKIASAAAAVAAAATAAAKILAWRRHGNQDFYENFEKQQIAKTIENIDGNRQKH